MEPSLYDDMAEKCWHNPRTSDQQKKNKRHNWSKKN